MKNLLFISIFIIVYIYCKLTKFFTKVHNCHDSFSTSSHLSLSSVITAQRSTVVNLVFISATQIREKTKKSYVKIHEQVRFLHSSVSSAMSAILDISRTWLPAVKPLAGESPSKLDAGLWENCSSLHESDSTDYTHEARVKIFSRAASTQYLAGKEICAPTE